MKARAVLKLIPVLIPSLAILLFYIWPLGDSVIRSFQAFNGDFVGFQNYIDMLNDSMFVDAFTYTLKVTLVVLIVTTVSSTILAMALRGTFIGKRIVLFLLQFDISIPSLACATMMILALSPFGFLSTLAENAGIISNYTQFPNILLDTNGTGLMVAIIWLFVPYTALSFLSVLKSVSNEQEEQAATLGVGKFSRFIHITLPSLKPSIAYMSILCFASVFSAFELPSLIGKQHTLVTLAYYYYNRPGFMDGYMESYAIVTVTSLISIIVSFILMYYSLTAEERRSD